MTMPTSFPRKFLEVRFPYEFSELYNKPVQYFGESTMTGAGATFGNPFGGETVNTMWHERKGHNTDFMTMSGVRENILKDAQGIMGQKNRDIRKVLQAGMSGGCSDCGKREDMMRGGLMNMMSPSTIEGANVLAGRGMRGGVMQTNAGAQYLARRLTARIAELDTADSSVNGVGAQNPNDDGELNEDDKILVSLGEYLDNIIEAVATGNIDSGGVSQARGFLKSLLAGGWQIPSNQLVMLQRNLDNTVVELEASMGNKAPTYALSSDRKKIVRNMLTTLERARTTVEQLVKNSYLAPKERKMVLEGYKPKLKQQLSAQLESQIPGRLRGFQQGNEVADDDFVDDGAFERTYKVPKRPSWYTSLAAIPGKVRLPRVVAERIAAQ